MLGTCVPSWGRNWEEGCRQHDAMITSIIHTVRSPSPLDKAWGSMIGLLQRYMSITQRFYWALDLDIRLKVEEALAD
jgi:hypothetical protein